ncbi:DUF1566 domain-containing protein [Nitrincola nitratireducens]|uniref:Lcl C-terminal domain-containing protein n=1 Tax=Nitrincola nitratireducens TaxID=1229521 RepID=W9VIR2_9GAMM|nr:DUF1566 domain-containing protein [Nitrincola nitratireducens]EXJ10475.1 hypothetical protein D791_02540 [Nitrincola nitratireducens]
MDKKFVVTKQLSKFFLLLTVFLIILTSFQAYASSERYQIVEGGSIVRDLVTGLEWQRCSVGQTWNGSTCVGAALYYNWSASLNMSALGGFHLPDIDQLATLLYCVQSDRYGWEDGYSPCGGFDDQVPSINNQYFPNTPRDWYWSASSGYSSGVMGVHFGLGGVFNGLTSSGHVRLVRVAQDDSRYQIIAGGSVIRDLVTNLEWQRCSVGQTWNGSTCIGAPSAFNWYEAMNIETSDGFALPDQNQLRSIVYCSNTNKYDSNGNQQMCGQLGQFNSPTINNNIFPNTPANSSGIYWTSSESFSNNQISNVLSFTTGGTLVSEKINPFSVRLVRMSQENIRYEVIEDGSIVKDLVTGLEWQRCSLGQKWNGRTCIGGPKKHYWQDVLSFEPTDDFVLPDIDQLATIVYFSDTSEYGANYDTLDCMIALKVVPLVYHL